MVHGFGTAIAAHEDGDRVLGVVDECRVASQEAEVLAVPRFSSLDVECLGHHVPQPLDLRRPRLQPQRLTGALSLPADIPLQLAHGSGPTGSQPSTTSIMNLFL